MVLIHERDVKAGAKRMHPPERPGRLQGKGFVTGSYIDRGLDFICRTGMMFIRVALG